MLDFGDSHFRALHLVHIESSLQQCFDTSLALNSPHQFTVWNYARVQPATQAVNICCTGLVGHDALPCLETVTSNLLHYIADPFKQLQYQDAHPTFLPVMSMRTKLGTTSSWRLL